MNHKVKQTLCLVSRRWRSIAQELIFEYLFLQDNFDWEKLASGLEASKRDDESRRGHGAGWYVRRLEIHTTEWTPKLGDAAARVIRCCPNLRVLTVGSMTDKGGIPPEIVDAVFETCPRALRSLDWTCDLGNPQSEQMLRLISRAEDLHSLFMFVMHPIVIAGNIEDLYDIEFGKLHTIELVSPDHDPSDLLSIMAHWKLPALKQLVLCGQSCLKDVTPFFEAHGAQVYTLEYDYIGEKSHEVLSLCPELRELVVNMNYTHPQLMNGHAKIERIGIRGLHIVERGFEEQRMMLTELKYAFPIFLNRAMFPNVTLVRLLDFDATKFKTTKWKSPDVGLWAFWIKRFERIGVRLEDHEGNLLTLKFSEINLLLPEDIAAENLARRAQIRPAQ